MGCAARAALASLAVLLAAASATAAQADASSKVLTSRDAALYEDAFSAARSGDSLDLSRLRRRLKDPELLGRLTYLKLMRPGYSASFEDLKDWLSRYRDQPGAEKIYALAKKRAPEAELGGQPGAPGRSEDGLLKPKASDGRDAARMAYYRDGDLEAALALASRSGERWIAGLSAYRLGRFDQAEGAFSVLAADTSQSRWTRSGAAFWAARAAISQGEPEKALQHLQLAATAPHTFYGMIAERQLGLDPGPDDAALGELEAAPPRRDGDGGSRGPLAAAQIKALIRSDRRARRAAAYVQIGLTSEAAEELKVALASTAAPEGRQRWRAFAEALKAPLPPAPGRAARFDIGDFPSPDLNPLGGFTLDKALVLAIVRQESSFDSAATSAAGAYGLMQVTEATAADNAGLSGGVFDTSLLLDPATNLRLGQDYMARLLSQTQGDLLRTVAAYNAGPRGVTRLAATMPDADSLLIIESLPAAETRDYVQKVMANYWTYRRLFSQPAPTLDALASGSKTVLAAWDRTPPPPAPAPATSPAPSASPGLSAMSGGLAGRDLGGRDLGGRDLGGGDLGSGALRTAGVGLHGASSPGPAER